MLKLKLSVKELFAASLGIMGDPYDLQERVTAMLDVIDQLSIIRDEKLNPDKKEKIN